MFWWGRVNAILAIVGFGGGAVLLAFGMIGEFFGLWVGLLFFRFCLAVGNTLYTALTGRPLFYDTRIDRRDE